MNQLDALKQYTVVVADTGDIESIKKYAPTDATTNPSLIYQAAKLPQYQALIDSAIKEAKDYKFIETDAIDYVLDKVAVNFGTEILKMIPGRISTEVDARLSFDIHKTVEKAKRIIELYKKSAVSQERVLIKIAATWEGIKAASILEHEGIKCNLTLVFSKIQAVACANNKITLISPFVGRILDWHKNKTGKDFSGATDPGVISVSEIYNYYKSFGIKTQIMGASFRNISEIRELAGCDYLTISPKLLQELKDSDQELPRILDPEKAKEMQIARIDTEEPNFRLMLNDDACATEKLSEGIRNFTKDLILLEEEIKKRLFA